MKKLNETQNEVLAAICGILLAFTPVIIMAIFQIIN